MYVRLPWGAWLHAEWNAIAAAPFSFLGALIVGWLIGWLGIRLGTGA